MYGLWSVEYNIISSCGTNVNSYVDDIIHHIFINFKRHFIYSPNIVL